jgi:ornithine cyclodeaminase/alanine dehydrogenase-like protein (mu-crystallin family)
MGEPVGPGRIARLAAVSMTAAVPPLRYLDGAAVEASMPPVEERLVLADLVMRSLATGAAQLPAKIGVSPRPESSFAHAMPAHLRGAAPADDLVGIKWVLGFPTNNALGITAIHAIAILNDPATGVPIAILDAGPITAHRTAAVSGLAIRQWGPRNLGRAPRAAIIGAGTQGIAHLPVLAHVLPDVDLAIWTRRADRAEALAETARATAGIGRATAVASAQDAVRNADVVVTAASFGPVKQVMGPDWLSPDALVVPVDYATYASAALARAAALFLVDERSAFEKNRELGEFDDYPDPQATIGEALIAGTQRPPGRALVTHLGLGLSDVVFGNAILRAATAAGRGLVLPR